MTENIDDKMNLFDPLYDYTNEGDAKNTYKELKGKEKFFAYMKYVVYVTRKMGTKEEKEQIIKEYGKICDPDSESILVRKVYKALWDNKYLIPCMDNGDIVKGDTLNSVNTTLDELYCKSFGLSIIGIRTIVDKYFSGKSDFGFLDNTHFEEFAGLYHTIGNFIPFPKNCNCPRGSFDSPVRDYWDLTMLQIYKYYNCSRCKEHIEGILGRDNPKIIETFMEWLDSFGEGKDGWENFVNKNYLRAFVYYKSDGTLFPKELWKGHFGGKVLPEREQCKEYFKNAAECIKERTFHLLEALQRTL